MPSHRGDLVKAILFKMAAYPLYETCLDTAGFAFLFNQLVRLADADRADLDRLEREPWMYREIIDAQRERISAELTHLSTYEVTDA